MCKYANSARNNLFFFRTRRKTRPTQTFFESTKEETTRTFRRFRQRKRGRERRRKAKSYINQSAGRRLRVSSRDPLVVGYTTLPLSGNDRLSRARGLPLGRRMKQEKKGVRRRRGREPEEGYRREQGNHYVPGH